MDRKSTASQGSKKAALKSPPKIKVDARKIGTIDHECVGCSTVAESCCAKYDVSVDAAQLKKITAVLPEAAEFCPHLKTEEGYANVFEDEGQGLHSIDTHENGLCVFAFRRQGLIRCSLHAVEAKLGLPLGTVKPQMCVLWPLTFTPKGDCLTLHDGALSCACSSLRKKPSTVISPALLETIQHFGGEITK